MRVLLLIDGLWVGGTERSLAEMLPHLRRAGIEPLVACLRRRREGVENDVLEAGVPVEVLPGPGLAAQVGGLRRLIAERRPRIVHSSLFRSSLVARLARPRSMGAVLLNSLVNTPYDAVRRDDPAVSAWKLGIVRRVDGLTGRLLVDHFHAVSHTVARAAVRDLGVPERRITVIERGRDPERLGAPSPERQTAVRRRLGLAPAAPVLLTVGRQDFQKGQEHLLRALPILLRSHPDLTLLMAGRDGPLTPRLETLAAAAGGGERVRFLGHRDDVPDLLAASDVFVLPSLFEGYPGAVLEALALAVPVVASDIPPVREILAEGETGLLVPPAEPPALAAAAERLLADPAARLRMGDAGRHRFLERHTAATAAARTAALYRKLAAAPPEGPGREPSPPGMLDRSGDSR